MKDAGQILRFVVERIAHIYERPLMYGGTPEGVDLILTYDHELWAEILDRREEFEEVYRDVLAREECGSANFSSHYLQRLKPGADNREAAEYVVRQWMTISTRLGLALPRSASGNRPGWWTGRWLPPGECEQ